MSGFGQAETVDELAAPDSDQIVSEDAAPVTYGIVNAPANLEDLFCGLAHVKEDLAMECQDIDETIAFLQAKRNRISEQYAPRIADLEGMIREEVTKQGKSFKCPVGKATYRKEYERASWDDKKLQGYAIQNPEIMTCRNVTIVQASVSISVGEQK